MRPGKSETSSSSGAAPAAELERALKDAITLHRKGNLTEAEKLYRHILKEQPRHFECLHHLGLIASQRGNHAAALAQIDAALEIRPNAAEAFNNRAIALRELNRLDEALASCDRAIAINPRYADAFNNRAITLKALGLLDDALACFDKAIAVSPEYAEAYNNRANTLRSLNRFADALIDYDRAIAVKGDYANAFNNRGLTLKELGRLKEALQSHSQAIVINPEFATAFNNRGNVLLELKRFDEALGSYDRAIALNGSYSDALNNRAIALKRLGHLEEALESCDRAIALKSDFAAAFNNRGSILNDLKRLDEAMPCFERAVVLDPKYVAAFINQGNTQCELGRLEDALSSYDQALVLELENNQALNNRGVVLKKLQRFEEALSSYNKAIALKPDYFEAINNRGIVLADLQRFGEAVSNYDQAIAFKPDYHDAFNNRGIALVETRRLEEGLRDFDRAIALRAGYTEAYLNRGNVLMELKRVSEAIATFDELLALKPDLPAAHLNRATARLLAGNFEGGWQDYERRWDVDQFPSVRPALDAKVWRGEDLAQHRIGVYTEQGLGDAIQFARYARLLADRAAIVTLLAPAKLQRLLSTLDPRVEVSASPKGRMFDFQCPLMSLPFHLGTDEPSIPSDVPYLKPDVERAAYWRHAIGDHGFKIGIAWQGRPNRQLDRGRSIPLTAFLRLARVPGVRLISLQKDDGLEQLRAQPSDVTVEMLGDKFDSGPDAFLDCAAVMSHLDLIITSDTSIAHLAGALARPTWIALKWLPEWRWQLDREDSPWYPTMRLFRQDTDGDWNGVFSKIERELRAKVPERRVVGPRENAAALILRGRALLDRKQFAEALALFDEGIAAGGDNADAFYGRGIALRRLKRLEEALASYDKAIALKPNFAEAFSNRGDVLKEIRRLDEAVASYEQGIAFNPRFANAFINRGNALHELGRLQEALASYDEAIVLDPGNADALNNRGVTLKTLRRLDEALASYDRAIALKPDYFEAFNNRGVALRRAKRFSEALKSFDRAIAINPRYADAYFNRANVLTELKRLNEAIADYDKCLALKPDGTDVIMDRGLVKLLVGRYAEGWQDYEWRWKRKAFLGKGPPIDAPQWQGEDIAGRRIAVYTEQGLGDAFQFARYVRLLAERGADVTLLAPAKLQRLLRGVGKDIATPSSIKSGEFDFQCPLMSLPLRFGTEESSIPHEVPYLTPEEEHVARWRAVIGDHGFKIGIVWQGSPDQKVDRGKSFPLSAFAGLARIKGVRLISLQKFDGLDQLRSLPSDVVIETLGDEFDGGPDAFVDCAAVMSHLDLIITPDTSVAHLAGALARPTWLALKYAADWRWLLDRQDTPWYPTMRLYRQETDGDWNGVFYKIERDLRALLSERLTVHHKEPDTAGETEPHGTGETLLQNSNLRLKRCRHGVMMFHANDTYIGRSLDLYGEFSASETGMFHELLRPGMTVVDAGANIGAHTLFFAQAVQAAGRVLAFEPQRILYNILCGNLALNGHGHVIAMNAALGSQPGSITVPSIDYERGGNLGGVALGQWESGEDVPVRTLDSYGLKSCQLIKIDVEGMEQDVLEGAVSLLKMHQPFLYVENDREKKSPDLIAWLLARGYRLYWHLPTLFNPSNYFGEKKNVFGNTISVNMLCVPRARAFTTTLREIRSPEESWRGS